MIRKIIHHELKSDAQWKKELLGKLKNRFRPLVYKVKILGTG